MRAGRARERRDVEESRKRAEASARQEQRAIRRAIEELIAALGETEDQGKGTLARVVTTLGVPEAQALLAETQAVEAGGGMLTADGSRRRTPGGVYLYLLKQRLTAEGKKALLKQIMTG